jgi:coenzyme F420 hydrogenase subunit beta
LPKSLKAEYVLFPVAHVYDEIIKNQGNYAVVGLPCQLHSLIKWQNINSKLKERIKLTIGLCCHTNLEPRVLKDLLLIKGIEANDVQKFEFRGGEWPGGIRVTLQDGTIRPLHGGDIKDGAFNYLKNLYMAKRCLVCTDYSAEFADISISDPWIRGTDGNYAFKGGWSIAHVRTSKGDRVISEMKASKDLVAVPVDHLLIARNIKSMTAHKKRGAFIRLKRMQKRRVPYPEYHLEMPTLGFKDYLRELKFQIILIGWHFTWLRPVILRFVFSSFGEKAKQFRAFTKKVKYRWRL